MNDRRVVVIGAGITGLALTDELRERGVAVETFEASGRPGGVIRSERVDGALLEYGPQRLRMSDPVARLVDRLELSGDVIRAVPDAPLYVLVNGRLRTVPRSLSDFLRTDLLGIRSKLRLLLEPLTDARRPNESTGDWLARRWGEEAYRNLIEPLLGGIYAADPRTMPPEHAVKPLVELERREGSLLRVALRRLRGDRETPPAISFTDGLATLPDALYDRNRAAVHLDTPVTGLHREDAWIVETTDGTTRADHVILTVPAWEVARLLPEACDALSTLTYNPLALVHLRADVDVTGFGYQVRRDEPLDTLGVTWHDGLFDRDGVYTAFLGGAWDPDVTDRDPAELGDVARREFARVMGGSPDVLDVTVLDRAMPAHDRSWAALDAVDTPDGITLATNYTGRIGVPSRVREARRIAESHGKRL